MFRNACMARAMRAKWHVATPGITMRAMTSTTPHKILVVDDDQRLRDLLRRYLTEQGFNVFLAENATAMNKLWTRERFDLVVLDLMLPGEDGLAICRKLRGANDTTPVIMLTARGDEVDRIIGLELGADDYLPKPFNPRELVARIHAVLRRRGAPEAPGAPASDLETFEFGPYTLNLQTRTLTHEGQTKSLTTGEFAVMKTFARHPRQPLSREKLMELARGREYEVFDRSLDVQISRLRKLIETDPSNPRYIQTVWGLGYVFIPDGPPTVTRAEPPDAASTSSDDDKA
jgi:two-component system, OmpR family, phosphate regulon response regulator OmpR